MKAIITFAVICLLIISFAYIARGEELEVGELIWPSNPEKDYVEWLESIDIKIFDRDEQNYVTGSIVPCIIKYESNGNPYAVGKCGEIGLMQISPIVLREWNSLECPPTITAGGITHVCAHWEVGALYNPEINIAIGKWYLLKLRNHYIPRDKYSIEVLLACYNWGIGNMKKVDWNWKRSPKSTQWYIKNIMECYECSQQ